MSAIAGIIGLSNPEGISEQICMRMLETMQPQGLKSTIQIQNIKECNAVLGRVAYGSDHRHKLQQDYPRLPCIAWVGEIYNDDCVTGQDSAWLLARYLQKGVEGFAQNCNGSFAAAIADPQEKSIILITDHTASQALFSCVSDGKLYFASEVKGLMVITNISKLPDNVAILSFLMNGYFFGGHTLIKDVRQMDYASLLIVRHGRTQTKQYWQYQIAPEENRGARYYIHELAERLKVAVRRRTRSGECGILLSGGIDSRGILCCMDAPEQVPAVTYTLRTRENRQPRGDWAIAEQLTRQYKIDFHVIQANPEEFLLAMEDSACASDGAAGFIFENIWDRIRQETNLDYLLIGDECVGWTFGAVQQKKVLSHIGIHPVQRYKELKDDILSSGLKNGVDQYTELCHSILQNLKAKKPNDQVDEIYMHQRLVHYLLPKRRVIQRHGFGVRYPWLDMDVMNFMQTVPMKYRIRKQLFIQALNSLNPHLMSYPLARADEFINYRHYLYEAERNTKAVTDTLLFSDIIQSICDPTFLHSLITRICQASPAQKMARTRNFWSLIPTPLRLRIVGIRDLLFYRSPHISDVDLLLRFLTLAKAKGFLDNVN